MKRRTRKVSGSAGFQPAGDGFQPSRTLARQAPAAFALRPVLEDDAWYLLQGKRWAALEGAGFHFAEAATKPADHFVGLELRRGFFFASFIFDSRGLSFRGIHTRCLELCEAIAREIIP